MITTAGTRPVSRFGGIPESTVDDVWKLDVHHQVEEPAGGGRMALESIVNLGSGLAT